VESSSDVRISSEVSGKVIYCNPNLNDGCNVEKGAVLVKIDPEDYEIAVNQAESLAAALVAETERTKRDIQDLDKLLKIVGKDFDLEEKNYNRVKDLYDKQVTSQSEMEKARQIMARRNKILIEMSNSLAKAKFNLRMLKNRLKEAKAKERQARLNLARTIIKAPITGRVDDCALDRDEYLKVGQSVCSIKVDANPEMSVSVNARDFANILNIRPDDKTHWFIIPEKMNVTAAWVESPKKCRWTMSVTRVKRYNADTDTITVLIAAKSYAGTDAAPYPLIPGMFCEVVFQAPAVKAFKIPFAALQIGNNVYTIDENETLHRHKVTPFHIEADNVLILSGLPDGEKVVAQPLPRGLVDGMKVKAVDGEATEGK
jgi:RND family efflux transporter MFP subunit